MRRRRLKSFFVVAAMMIGTLSAEYASAGGYWNMPGTLSQRAGHGYSGGYHAPFLLGPIKLDGWGAPNEVRLPCSPVPICGCSSGCAGCDCYGMMSEPSTIEETVPTAGAQAVERVPTRVGTPTRPLFIPPVSR
jgi:hypothetical protein